MAKLKMKRIEIIAMLADSQNIVERLQRRGVVELTDVQDENLVKLLTSSSMSRFEKNIDLAKEAVSVLDSIAPRKQSLLSMLDGRENLTTAKFAEKKVGSEETLRICAEISELTKQISDLKNNIIKLQTQIDVLTAWEPLDIPQNFKGTKTTRAFIGTLPGAGEDFASQIKDATDTDVYCEVIGSRKELSYLFIVCYIDDEKAVADGLRSIGFTAYQSSSSLTVNEEIKELQKEIAKDEELIETLTERIKSFGGKQGDIEFLIDLLSMSYDKYEAISKLGVSRKTIVLSGFIPEKYAKKLIDEFEEKYDAVITVTDVSEDDDVPVLLQNGKFAEPVEGITEMYALPGKNDVDPNPVMAFFYYFFFGMMLSDAGYGLLMLIGTTWALTKTKVEGTLRRSIKMFQYCSISTLFWGALFGSWFGDLPQVIAREFFGCEIKTTALWFEPISNPVTLLLFCFGFGIVHLFVGLGVNFYMQWKSGKKLDALCDVIPVYVTILGVCPFGASIFTEVNPKLQQIGLYVALVGVVLVILTSGRTSKNVFMRFFGGLYGVYNLATGYLGDIMSYSRLLALGLATGSIANVINLLGTMPSNPIVKAILLIVVGIAGHILNLLINLLGAYVHTDRLQFVEMFSKFYEGGGRAFAPLKSNTKTFKFKKENIYE